MPTNTNAITRNTIQQELVAAAVKELGCHATAEEVFAHISKSHPHVSRATVYRNLQRLSGCGAIKKVEVPGGADRYDHQCHEHYHAKCLDCGRVFDVDMDYIGDMKDKIRDTHGFDFTGYDIVFTGLCGECKAKAKKAHAGATKPVNI